MSERAAYAPGTPSWVDLTTTDPAAAKTFYGELFGWEAEDAGSAEETGGYAMFKLRGRNVAGVGPVMDPSQPPVWSTYVSTDDAAAAVERAREAGGQVIVEPMQVMDAGTLAFVAHPAGGYIGLWQPGNHIGAELVNEPGALTWNQLHTDDRPGASAFYGSVFGWSTADFGGMAVFNLGDAPVGGLMDRPPGSPEGGPAFWMTIFSVADTDAAVAKADELGGTVVSPPSDLEGVGRFALLSDPQGVFFGVIARAEG